jgi:hypothetical protein
MCSSETDCGTQASCVAGRCVARGATPAIATARRLLVEPVDIGWVRRSDGPGGDVALLGRGDGAVVFARFSVQLAPEAKVVEAYLLLERAPGIDADPSPVTMHAARVTGAWDGRSLTWGSQPPVEEIGAPVTRVTATSGRWVRIDVGSLVDRWRKRGPGELGVAVVTEGQSATGLPIALGPVDVPAGSDDPVLATQPAPDGRVAGSAAVGDPRRQVGGPRLELYVR